MDKRSLLLYLVTDPVLCGSRGLEETSRLALKAGVTALQLRDKAASARSLMQSAEVLKRLCSLHEALFLVNDRVDIALACMADGVHLGQDDIPVRVARKLLGPDVIIGVSARSEAEAIDAWKGGADYIAANMIFSTATKTNLGKPLGLQAVRTLKDATPLPLVAIGGIDSSNVKLVRKAGADGIAVVSAIMAAEDVGLAVENLLLEM